MTSPLQMLSARSVAEFTIWFYWPALVASLAAFCVRLYLRTLRQELVRYLRRYQERYFLAIMRTTSWIPVCTWSWLAHNDAIMVNATHASIYPNQILASMQEFLGGIVLLIVVLGVDAAGGKMMQGHYLFRKTSPQFSFVLIMVSFAPIIDRIFLTYYWWMYFIVLGR